MPERPGIRKKITQRLEITYAFHPKKDYVREHWMYVEVTGKDIEDCKEKAKKYYESQIRSLGWGRITTLKSIGSLTNTNDSPKHRKNNDLSGGRSPAKSSSTGGRKSRSTRRKKR